MKQFKFNSTYKKSFGGELLIVKRKTQRPLSMKKPIHLVLRSSQAKVFIPWSRSLEKLIYNLADRFHVKIYDLSLNWNHIHSVIMIKDRKNYNQFIRALTSLLAEKIRRHLKITTPIFTLRPFTRILEWGRDFERALDYLLLNQLESLNLVNRLEKDLRKKLRWL